MREPLKSQTFSRRRFLKQGAGSAAILGALGVGVIVSRRIATRRNSGTASAQPNPFAYDLSHLAKTDPNLIHYQQTGSFPCPHDEPRKIALGPQDHRCVAASNYVSVLDHDGGVLFEVALSAPARALTVANDGFLYVSLRDHIEVFDSKGLRRAAWDSPGRRTWFTGLAVSESELFAADAGHRVVLRYDRTGKLVGRIGDRNGERNISGFIVPSPYFAVALARDGLLRITNPGRHRVEVYTIDGEFEFAWGKTSTAIDGFCGCCNPISLALLPDGRTVTCEKGLPRVKIFAPDGTFESVVAGPEAFPEHVKISRDATDGTIEGIDAAVDSLGRICILDPVAREVRIMVKKAG